MQAVRKSNQNLQHQLKIHNGVVKRGVTKRGAEKMRCQDENHQKALKDFDERMIFHVSVGADASCWDHCWSSDRAAKDDLNSSSRRVINYDVDYCIVQRKLRDLRHAQCSVARKKK